jgi:hypothetical protein
VSLDKSGFVRLKVLLGVHIVRVLLDLMRLGLLTIVHTLFEVIFHYVHLSDDALEANKLIGKLASETSGGDKVCSEIAFEANLIVLYFSLELGPLVPEESPFEMIFAEAIINMWIFHEILSSLRGLLSELVDVDLQCMRICCRDSRDEVIKLALAIL